MWQRRRWLQLSLLSAGVLAIGGGAALFVGDDAKRTAGDAAHRLTDGGRMVFGAVGRAVLDAQLPAEALARDGAVTALLDRIDTLIVALPAHAQAELSQLLAILASAPGRRALAGLTERWPDAPAAAVQAALQDMRVSRLQLRRQAYQALRDIVAGAWFADPSTWRSMGYPGPLAL